MIVLTFFQRGDIRPKVQRVKAFSLLGRIGLQERADYTRLLLYRIAKRTTFFIVGKWLTIEG